MGCGASKEEKVADPTPQQNPAGPKKTKPGSLGIVRLDYDYPPALGDIDHPGSFGYAVHYKVVPGLTFEMCQSGVLTPEVERRFVNTIRYFDGMGVTGITGDCGFMMYLQQLARRSTKKPVFMSALAQLPAITSGFASNEQIAIFTANGAALSPMRELIRKECGVDTQQQRFVIVGCEEVPYFDAVKKGERVPVEKVMPEMVKKAKEVLEANPNIRAILLECTELPPYSNALREETGLPVYDAITACDFFLMGVQNDERFGIQDWQAVWDGKQEEYVYAKNLTDAEKQMLINKPPEERAAWMQSIDKPFSMTTGALKAQLGAVGGWLELETVWGSILAGGHHQPVRARPGSLGVVCMDTDAPPSQPGDINYPGSFAYEVYYKTVAGLTYEMCESGTMTPEVEQRFVDAVNFLKGKGVAGISADCGFMMSFQQLARQSTEVPVFLSALAQLPTITCAFASDEQIAIFTMNSESLNARRELIRKECGVDMQGQRFVIVECEQTPQGEAAACLVAKAKQVLKASPAIRAILLESASWPQYSDSLRKATRLPVFDAVTACDFFMTGVQDNERFGIQDWQPVWNWKVTMGQPSFVRRV